jgi:hypothetical protein
LWWVVTGYPFAPPPDRLQLAGPSVEVLERARATVAGERRRALDVTTAALSIDDAGRLRVGSLDAVPFEEHGLRTLLGHYGDAFPRACPYLSTLPGPVAGPLLSRGLSTPGLPAEVRLRIRGPGAGALFAAVPTSYAPYDVDAVLGDLVDAGAAEVYPLARVEYDAALSAMEVRLSGAGHTVRVTASDAYGGAVRFDVVRLDAAGEVSQDYGDPVPAPPRRKRGDAMAGGLVDWFAARLRAAPAWYAYRHST